MKICALGMLAVAAAFGPAVARADEPPILAKARACLGSEAALDGVRSLHFVGRIIRRDADFPNDRSKDKSNLVEIYFEKPWREAIVVRDPGRTVETALDDFDGWQRLTDAASGQPPRLVLLGSDITENLRADTWENLYFYRGLEEIGGRIEDEGRATVDGVACEKVAFVHSPTIVYHRYFDLATGRLVFTHTAAGVDIRERGEFVAGGVRFPRAIVTEQESAGGKLQMTTYEFTGVTVNEALPDRLFVVPPMPTSPP